MVKKSLFIILGHVGKNTDSTLKVSKGGMYESLVNGYHPNKFGLN